MMSKTITYQVVNNNNGTVTIIATDGHISRMSTINSEFIEVVQDVDGIDPVEIVQQFLKEKLTKQEKKYEV